MQTELRKLDLAPRSAADRRDLDGFTLAEVAVAMLLAALLAVGILLSVRLGRQVTFSTAQRVAAFGMAKAKFEEVRGFDYDDIAATNFPAEAGLQFVHLSGRDRQPVSCLRSTTITPRTAPERKEVTVSVDWQFGDQNLQELVAGIVYPR